MVYLKTAIDDLFEKHNGEPLNIEWLIANISDLLDQTEDAILERISHFIKQKVYSKDFSERLVRK